MKYVQTGGQSPMETYQSLLCLLRCILVVLQGVQFAHRIVLCVTERLSRSCEQFKESGIRLAKRSAKLLNARVDQTADGIAINFVILFGNLI